MGVCEPGQGGNAAAISITFMCAGEPPRLSQAPASGASSAERADCDHSVDGAEVASPRCTDADAPWPQDLGTEKPVRRSTVSCRKVPRPKNEPRSQDDRAGASPGRRPTSRRRAGLRDAPSGDYTVVARRYRPQRFEDVVGQDHVVQALRNAIRLNRLAQAYLFCGTRGVGKTSMARIFAKCLNCVNGPTEEPCQVCDICQAIAVGPGRRRDRDRRGQQQRRRAGPRAAAERLAPAQPVPVQDLLHRRSPHALDGRLQRAA